KTFSLPGAEPSSHHKRKRKRDPVEEDSEVSEIEKATSNTVRLKRGEDGKLQSMKKSMSPPAQVKVRQSTPKVSTTQQHKSGKKNQGTYLKKKRSDAIASDNDAATNQTITATPFRPSGPAGPSSAAPLHLQPPPPAFGSVVRAQSVPITIQNGSAPETAKTSHHYHSSRPREKDKEEEPELTRVKPKDQVAIQTFWQSMEPYFRLLTEDDRVFLEEKGDNVKPYLIPPLGKNYLEVWAEEERSLIPTFDNPNSPSSSSSSSRRNSIDNMASGNGNNTLGLPNRPKYLGPNEYLTDDHLSSDEIGCGPLTERILCSLVKEEVVDSREVASRAEDDDDEQETKVKREDEDAGGVGKDRDGGGKTIVEMSTQPRQEVLEFEERLKRELRFIGLLGDDDIDWNAREDDEVCAELRQLQKRLKDDHRVNQFRRRRLLDIVHAHMGYQEYNQILDHLDAQVEQSYMKRFRVQKSKKRKTTSTPKSLSDNAVHAMERRRRWVGSVGALFRDKGRFTIPERSVFADEEAVVAQMAAQKNLAVPPHL
ncbi:histone acetyltransferases subunit 3-domain-containing protein, partial [Jimgerdemannia flammicorona]